MRTLLLLLLLTSPAAAQCVIRGATLDLPPYSALQVTQGALTLTVTCDAPLEPVTLDLTVPGPYTLSGGDVIWTLTPTDPARPGPTLTVRLLQAQPLLTGLPLLGSQTVRIGVRADAGQWSRVGTYGAPLTFSLRPPLP